MIEIDARLPSQTPAAVFHASDANIVELLAETFAAERPPAAPAQARRGAVYEHVLVESGRVEVLGEHIVGAAGPLRRCDGLFGADVVLTDRPDSGAARGRWVAVLMTRGATAAAARERAAAAVARLADEHGLELVAESEPGPVRPTRREGALVTRLVESDVRALTAHLDEVEGALLRLTGCDFVTLAARACGVSEGVARDALAHAAVAVVPITSGEGVIAGFVDCVAAICARLGCRAARVTEATDVAGFAEAFSGGDDLVFAADDRTFLAFDLSQPRRGRRRPLHGATPTWRRSTPPRAGRWRRLGCGGGLASRSW